MKPISPPWSRIPAKPWTSAIQVPPIKAMWAQCIMFPPMSERSIVAANLKYSSPEHNRAVGGAARSKHFDGAAFDIAMSNHDPVVFEAAAREVGFLGFYPRSGFIHVDLGPARPWGERFTVRATAFAAEPPPTQGAGRQPHEKDGGAAGVVTLDAAGVEVPQSVLAETQTAILPLVPYLDTLRWVFIAVALGGIAVTIYARLDDWKRGRR